MRRATAALLTVVGVATLALGGVASAKPKKAKAKKQGPVVTRTASAQGAGDAAIITANATCPKKTRAVGGGFSGTPATGDVIPAVFESVKVGQNGWRASSQVSDNAPFETVSLTVSVYCRRGAPKTVAVSNTTATPQAPPLNPQPSTATCPGRKLALAGGFSTPPPALPSGGRANVVSDSFRVSPVSWQAAAFPAAPSSVTSHAYCAKSKKQFAAITASSPAIAASLTPGTATAACVGKPNPLAGGFSQAPALGTPTGIFFTYESQRADRKSWRASGVHFGTGGSTLSAIAYCG